MDVWQTASVPVAEELRVSNVQSEVGQTPVADVTSGDSLREAIRAASASSEGKTMSYFSTVTSSVPAAATAVAPVQQGTGDPVVGWLVCIQGPCLGWSFQIGAGNNTIGRNLTIDTLRKRKNYVPLDEVEGVSESGVSIEEDYLRSEKNAAVRRCMDHLKSEHTQALWLVYFESFSYADAARVMKKTKRQFDSLIFRAKTSLKAELIKEGITYDEL